MKNTNTQIKYTMLNDVMVGNLPDLIAFIREQGSTLNNYIKYVSPSTNSLTFTQVIDGVETTFTFNVDLSAKADNFSVDGTTIIWDPNAIRTLKAQIPAVLTLVGRVDTTSLLPTTASNGDVYLVGDITTTSKDMYVYLTSTSQWEKMGNTQTLTGDMITTAGNYTITGMWDFAQVPTINNENVATKLDVTEEVNRGVGVTYVDPSTLTFWSGLTVVNKQVYQMGYMTFVRFILKADQPYVYSGIGTFAEPLITGLPAPTTPSRTHFQFTINGTRYPNRTFYINASGNMRPVELSSNVILYAGDLFEINFCYETDRVS